jgi:hypothetical protein
MKRVRLAWDLLRTEGPGRLVERLADRREERRIRAGERAARPEDAVPPGARLPVLDVLVTPLAARWGGVPTQLAARLEEERKLRPTALLVPESGRWILRTACGFDRRRVRLGVARAGTDPWRFGMETVDVVREAARLVGAAVVNVEGAAGWSPDALGALVGPQRRLVLSLHDFALYCPRPNLVEEPSGRFCGYSRDPERCGACLSSTWSPPTGLVAKWRASSEALLSSVDAVVYPSEFLRRQHAALFPGAHPRLERVIAPPAPLPTAPGPSKAKRGGARERPFHAAFVGAYRTHKGARGFAALLRARRLGAHVAGHYRAGGLANRLEEGGVDLALLLSIWPETFGLTLSECRAAGVPVLAFSHGAIGERVAAEGGGILVPPEEGAEGVKATLSKLLAGEIEVPPFRGQGPGLSPSRAASERTDLYRALLAEPAGEHR